MLSEKALYEEYAPYLTRMEVDAIQLNRAGWTKLLHSLYDDVLRQEFGLAPIKDHCWADSYQDGRRRVISLFLINNGYATLQWGWNFAYIPRMIAHKARWCRTDQSIYTHTFEVPAGLANHTAERHKVVFTRYGKNHQGLKGLSRIVREHTDARELLLPQMRDYYAATATYEGMLERLEEAQKSSYYRILTSGNPLIYAFVERYMGRVEKAEKDFAEIAFTDDVYRQEWYKKFSQIN